MSLSYTDFLAQARVKLAREGITSATVSGLSWSNLLVQHELDDLCSFWDEVPGVSYRCFSFPEIHMYIMAIWVAPK